MSSVPRTRDILPDLDLPYFFPFFFATGFFAAVFFGADFAAAFFVGAAFATTGFEAGIGVCLATFSEDTAGSPGSSAAASAGFNIARIFARCSSRDFCACMSPKVRCRFFGMTT